MVSPCQHKTESCFYAGGCTIDNIHTIRLQLQTAVNMGKEIWFKFVEWKKKKPILVKVPIIWKVANCLENRKDFKDLINLKSFLFIARLNSNQLWELSVCARIQCVVCVCENYKSKVLIKLFHENQSAELSDVPRSNPKVIQEAVTNPQILN